MIRYFLEKIHTVRVTTRPHTLTTNTNRVPQITKHDTFVEEVLKCLASSLAHDTMTWDTKPTTLQHILGEEFLIQNKPQETFNLLLGLSIPNGQVPPNLPHRPELN